MWGKGFFLPHNGPFSTPTGDKRSPVVKGEIARVAGRTGGSEPAAVRFTRERSLVRAQPCPFRKALEIGAFLRVMREFEVILGG
jgi:hypothetical protein